MQTNVTHNNQGQTGDFKVIWACFSNIKQTTFYSACYHHVITTFLNYFKMLKNSTAELLLRTNSVWSSDDINLCCKFTDAVEAPPTTTAAVG